MSATAPDWRVHVKKGDILSTQRDLRHDKASWYEVMGIMVVGITKGDEGGVDPFTGHVDQTDYLTHGRLPENIDPLHAQANRPTANAIRLARARSSRKVIIRNFAFPQGDLRSAARAACRRRCSRARA